MKKILLVLGDVDSKQIEPLRAAMARTGVTPMVVRVSSMYRDSEMLRRQVDPDQTSVAVEKQIKDFERVCLATLIAEKDENLTLQDVTTVLIEYRPSTDVESPWAWVDDHLPREGVSPHHIRLSTNGSYFWIEGRAYHRLDAVQIPTS